jgi:hypothetical protein
MSLRTIFAIAADSDLRLDQWDLKNSFIQQRLDVEHMYMECPDGYSKDDGERRARSNALSTRKAPATIKLSFAAGSMILFGK